MNILLVTARWKIRLEENKTKFLIVCNPEMYLIYFLTGKIVLRQIQLQLCTFVNWWGSSFMESNNWNGSVNINDRYRCFILSNFCELVYCKLQKYIQDTTKRGDKRNIFYPLSFIDI